MSASIINEGIPDDDSPMSAINVTSLVDVMFCLLIMFMVATPLMSPDASDAITLPAGHGEEVIEAEYGFFNASIIVDAKGKVFLGTLPLPSDPDKLADTLEANVVLREQGTVFIQGDQNANYGRIVDVLVALKEAKISSVGFITDPDDQRLRGKK